MHQNHLQDLLKHIAEVHPQGSDSGFGMGLRNLHFMKEFAFYHVDAAGQGTIVGPEYNDKCLNFIFPFLSVAISVSALSMSSAKVYLCN